MFVVKCDLSYKYFLSSQYAQTHVPGPGLDTNPNEIIYNGCDCIQASCYPDCPCSNRFGTNYNTKGQFIKGPSISQSQPVFECNSSCKCGPECINRVVQNGIKFSLEVFQAGKKGYGLKTLDFIPKDSFVSEYAGEVLTLDEALRRTRAMKPNDMNFIMVIRECLANGKVIRTHIDPSSIGNIGRFINHSCEPNLYLITVRVDNDIPKVALFAIRDIGANEELSYSYWGDQTPSIITDTNCNGVKMSQCFCQSEKCLGLLPYNEHLYEPDQSM